MNISPAEAEEALVAIQIIAQKTRHSMASAGTYVTLIVTGLVWLIGFTCTQFLPEDVIGYIWTGLSLFGGALGTILGFRLGRRVHSPSTSAIARRYGLFWLLLAGYCLAAIAIAWPLDGKQATMFIVLFLMVGYLSMSLLFSIVSVWWPLPITVLALISYFLLPDLFFLWMGILCGGGMIILGLYIRYRW